MASSPFALVHQGHVTVVYVKGSYEACAWIYKQSSGGFRFRLANYPHKMSAEFGDMKNVLKRLEGEVL